jgi:hypothetical protein
MERARPQIERKLRLTLEYDDVETLLRQTDGDGHATWTATGDDNGKAFSH